jgi:ribonuclease BN (tRNA processing enzyme)
MNISQGIASMKITLLGTGHGDPTFERFNTSILLQPSGGGAYMLDAGVPVGILVKKKFPFQQLRAVFLSHMHEDHLDGLPGILKFQMKYAPELGATEIWLPEKNGILMLQSLLRAVHLPIEAMPGKLTWHTITPGPFFTDDTLSLTAVPNRHLETPWGNFPSYGFVVSGEGKKIVYTGDLSNDFADFPAQQANGADLCIVELTHYNLEEALPRLQQLTVGKLVFTHVGSVWHGAKGERRFVELTKRLPYETTLAHDDDVLLI